MARRFARQAVSGEPLQIGVPQFLLPLAQLVEIGPGINTGIVKIVEQDAHGVVADRLQAGDPDLGAAGDQLLLLGTMALTSAEGLSTRSSSAGRRNVTPLSKSISRIFSAWRRRISVGQ